MANPFGCHHSRFTERKWLDMVKLQFSIIKKRYKNGRRIYQYERISLVFPREFQDLLRQLRHRQLKIKVTRQNRTTNIVLIDNEDP